MKTGRRVILSILLVAGVAACGGGGGTSQPPPNTSSSSSALSSSSATSSRNNNSNGGSARPDPCALTAQEVSAAVGFQVGDGRHDGAEICRYVEQPNETGGVDVVVNAAPSGGLAAEKAREPVPVEDIAGLGSEAYLADYFPSAALSVIRGDTKFYVQVSGPRDDNSDTGFVYDRAALKSQAIALMNKLLAK